MSNMGLRKKKNIIAVTICMIVCFIVYQLYFFLSLTSSADIKVVSVPEHVDIEDMVHVRPESDKYINPNGVFRGVLISNMPQYRPDSKGEFKCLASEHYIPFEQVNDDYCDCDDASDEPSTNACTNGTFYCDRQSSNKNNEVLLNTIASSMVNDGICDCCDGSDEFEPSQDGLENKLLMQANKRHFRYYATQCLNTC